MFTLKSDMIKPGIDAPARPISSGGNNTAPAVPRAFINTPVPPDSIVRVNSQPQGQVPQAQPAAALPAQAAPLPKNQAQTQNLAQNMAQVAANMAANSGQMAQNLVGQVASFFKGNKKDNQVTDDEKEMRDHNDAGLLDMFGDNPFNASGKVNTRDGAGLGGSGK